MPRTYLRRMLGNNLRFCSINCVDSFTRELYCKQHTEVIEISEIGVQPIQYRPPSPQVVPLTPKNNYHRLTDPAETEALLGLLQVI